MTRELPSTEHLKGHARREVGADLPARKDSLAETSIAEESKLEKTQVLAQAGPPPSPIHVRQ